MVLIFTVCCYKDTPFPALRTDFIRYEVQKKAINY